MLTMPIESEPRLGLSQCFALLKAVEDLESVTSRIYSQCEECFRSTIAAYHGQAAPASPHKLLKTMSSMASANSFSLLGSSMSDSQNGGDKRGGVAFAKHQSEKRGWDWRKGFGRDAKGEDVLRILRQMLAKHIARYWIDKEKLTAL